jgi:hypothetical protein
MAWASVVRKSIAGEILADDMEALHKRFSTWPPSHTKQKYIRQSHNIARV